MSSQPLRVGIIGAGSWAVSAHIPSLASRSEVELWGVNRRGAVELERVAQRFGFRVATEDYRELVESGLDLAVVASPTKFHYEHAKAALESGAHVLCEKPFTIAPVEAWDLVNTAQRLDRHLLVAFGWNFTPLVEQAHLAIREADLGEVEHVSVTMSSATRGLLTGASAYADASAETVPDPETWTNPALSGGGYGQAQLSHALALALHLTGESVTSALALTHRPANARVELHDAFAMRLRGGGIASVSGASSFMGFDNNRHHLAVEVVAERGQYIVDLFQDRVCVFNHRQGQVELPLQPGAGHYNGSLPSQRLVDLALGLTKSNPASGALGARTVEALDLAYRSEQSRAPEDCVAAP
ncbi:Gfo/Idh/MocA family oxidoreductase [Nocardioides sp.]|uniref:Gfo/Idh/MocA family protein n=1 Tax=Nocardioides sp. TaxID=35761 RepID=UPI002623AA8B|nr:Gfo/Idh/MocA family oxidoreductase [Nocardioides sp.]MDI6911724.1 Gfo/Idh/MocA family oxidoreductase [Nocardioides sp.]